MQVVQKKCGVASITVPRVYGEQAAGDFRRSMKADDEICAVLIGRIARGDRASLAELFASEAGRLLAVARRILRRPDLAEEAVQDAFVSVWQRASTFDRARGSG